MLTTTGAVPRRAQDGGQRGLHQDSRSHQPEEGRDVHRYQAAQAARSRQASDDVARQRHRNVRLGKALASIASQVLLTEVISPETNQPHSA